ncbi:unnamed protein product [Didymodactylos carnosus]|uniref:Uncharacterized protein n=1 Tax=Didymodactylos carnosus TaxID=1234261 RepID=A0A815AKC3_9BILA|nr:unnamed protein product [Didymodactylos carnosus]CAF4030919.1 unnamed protein product [Didymodactylos carnosus]
MHPTWYHLPVDRASTPKILSNFPRTSTPITRSITHYCQSPRQKRKCSTAKQLCWSSTDIRASSTQSDEHKHRKKKKKVDLKYTRSSKISKQRKNYKNKYYTFKSGTLPVCLHTPSSLEHLHYFTTSTNSCYKTTRSCAQYTLPEQQHQHSLVKIWVV